MTATVRLETIPGGLGGTQRTLDRMVELVNASLPVPQVRAAALAAVRGCEGRDYGCQLARLRQWLATHFRFIRDPRGVEYLQAPAYQLAVIARDGLVRGDCDDAALLAAALGKVLGFPARFVALGFLPAKVYSHVYAELQQGGRWWEYDVTRPGSLPRGLLTRHLLTQPI